MKDWFQKIREQLEFLRLNWLILEFTKHNSERNGSSGHSQLIFLTVVPPKIQGNKIPKPN